MKKSLYSYIIPLEYRSYVEDLSRMIILQLTANILFSISDPNRYSFFSKEFITTLSFIIIGISVYWLIFRKIILFTPPGAENKEQKFYTGGD